ncbi:MAG: hypothetical protein ACM3X0_02305 [Bacteroidota bacterium]
MSVALPPLWLDYQRLPPGRRLPGIALLVGSVLLAGFLVQLAVNTGAETTVAEQQVARLRQAAERRRLFEGADRAARDAEAAASAGKTLSPSASRWAALFSSLEAASDETVTLLSLAPGAREIVITGEAKDLDAALDYAKRLLASRVLANPHLAKYEVVREHPRQPVRFTLLAEWREGTG